VPDEDVNNLLGILSSYGQVVNIDGNVLILVAIRMHPNVRLSFGGNKSHFIEAICEMFMSVETRSMETIQCLADH